MIKFEGRVVDVLYKQYYNDRAKKETTIYEWLLGQSTQLGIKKIYRFEYVLVFETSEDEVVFRLKFGI